MEARDGGVTQTTGLEVLLDRTVRGIDILLF
jgi:hypothetical protein